jgi:hypothetical protein
MDGERGTGSVEWVALLGVVGGVFAAAAAAAPGVAPAVPRAVGATFERAFCLVSGGDCLSGRPRPCVVRSRERTRERRASLALVRLADGRTVLREERSDGTVVLTVEDTASAGTSDRLEVRMAIGGHRINGSAGVRGGVRLGRGRRFVLPDAAAADRLLARLGEERAGARGVVAGQDLAGGERWWAVTHETQAKAALRLNRLGADVRLDGSTVAGVRERPSGERTLVLRTDSELVAALTGPLARVGAVAPGHASVELALDRDRAPVSLTVRVARGVQGEVRLGPWRSRSGDLLEAEARLDLADPVVRSQAASLLSPRRALPAARALAERLADWARIDLRVYETDRSESVKGASGGPLKLGYEVVEVVRSGRLVDAVGREPGLGWTRRIDCVGVA